jgi:hypothetical protein
MKGEYMTKSQLNALEEQEMKLHRIRIKVVTFKQLVQAVYDSGSMSYEQWNCLEVAAQVSEDYNDSLTLNKLTVIFPNTNLN